jgi:glycosyltransferase involved in cell wall biosynthesis
LTAAAPERLDPMCNRFPLVSIVVPNLNYLSFLKDRIASILAQTYTHWECIVIDGQSTDGSWAFFQKTAERDSRFRIYQEPPNGIYDAWNKGIERAQGDYVYIATSDDTMMPDFLEKMLMALQACPTAGIAHCCLTLIDENGDTLPTGQWNQWKKIRFFGDWINRYHIRRFPHDALLHSVFTTVYSSVTQLLIRKSLFDKVGLFENGFGPISDFEWGLNASLNTDTVHVPLYLATWRCHKDQATDNEYKNRSSYFDQLLTMIDSAYRKGGGTGIPKRDLKGYYFNCYFRKLRNENPADTLFNLLGNLCKGLKRSPSLMLSFLLQKFAGDHMKSLSGEIAARSLLAKYPAAAILPMPCEPHANFSAPERNR